MMLMCPDPTCSAHGKCEGGKCHCQPDWTGLDTNGVRELHKSTLRKAALHNRLSHLAADVRRRPVDLGRVLAGERTAAVRTPPTVGVDDDLAPGDTGVALRTADDELARRVEVEIRVVAEQRQRRLAVLEDVLNKLLVHLLHRGSRHLLPSVPRALLRAL